MDAAGPSNCFQRAKSARAQPQTIKDALSEQQPSIDNTEYDDDGGGDDGYVDEPVGNDVDASAPQSRTPATQPIANGALVPASYIPSQKQVEDTMLNGTNTATKRVLFTLTTTVGDLANGVTLTLPPSEVEDIFSVHPRGDSERGTARVGDLARVIIVKVLKNASFLSISLPVTAQFTNLPGKMYTVFSQSDRKGGRANRVAHLLLPGGDKCDAGPELVYSKKSFEMLRLATSYGHLKSQAVRDEIVALPPPPDRPADYVEHLLVPDNNLVMHTIRFNADGWGLDPEAFQRVANSPWRAVPADFTQYVLNAIDKMLNSIQHDSLYDFGVVLRAASPKAAQMLKSDVLDTPVTAIIDYTIKYVLTNGESVKSNWKRAISARK
jgi:hypothetical protein